MALNRLRKALVPGWKGSPSLGMLIVRARQELKHTEDLKQHVQELREAKLQEAAIAELRKGSQLQDKEEIGAARATQGERSRDAPENAKTEDSLVEKLEQEQRNQAQQRAKLKSIIDAFRKGET